MAFDKSHPVFPLSDALVEELCAVFPEMATHIGVAGFDDRWPDLSPEGAEHSLAALGDMRRRVAELPPATDRWEELAIQVAGDDLDRLIARFEHGDHLRDLNSVASPVQAIREMFDHMRKDTAEAWNDIMSRLESLGKTMAGYRRSLDEGRRQGMAVPVRQVDEAARQAAVTASEESSFLALRGALDDSGVGDETSRARLEGAITVARDAYGELVDYLRNDYRESAPVPDAAGGERYRHEAMTMLGTELDLAETYAWGWEEVTALRQRMDDVAGEIAPGGGLAEALEVLKTDPARAAATPEELVAFLSVRLDEALQRLAGTHFDVPEQIRRCDVKLTPPGGPLVAYYVGPSEDFTRAGSVWWSIERDKPKPLYDEVSTAYHEGFPGHHLQVGLQMTLAEHLSRLHRVWVWMPGTGEGWALYAERLMDELGYLDQPDYVFGYLTSQMLRACRVVIDIGSHLELPIPEGQPFHPGEPWSYETAVEMLESYATLDGPYAHSEVTRYLGWPAQAIAYKVGERQILRIREELRRREGDAFDLKAFHRRVLEVGPVGLDVMRRFVLAEN